MPNIRTSCLSVDECDTPDEVRQNFDDVYGHLRALQGEINNLAAALRKLSRPSVKPHAEKGGQ